MPPDQLATTAFEAAALYRRGVALVLADRSKDAIPLLRAAIAVDPHFALAQAALAVAESAFDRGCAGWQNDRWRVPIELASRERNASRRERQHVAVIALVLNGQLARASALGREHLQEFPDDELVLQSLSRSGVEVDDLGLHPLQPLHPLQQSVE